MSTALDKLSAARRMLAEVKTVPEAVQVADLAAAAQAYARRAKLGLEAQNDAAEIKLRAERLAGEMLRELEKRPGERTDRTSSNGGQGSSYAATLRDADVSRQDASRWQKVAAFGAERFDELIATCRDAKQEITTAYMLRAWRREVKNADPKAKQGAAVTGALSDLSEVASLGPFGTICADPPWRYGNQATRAATGDHYGGMLPEEVAALPISGMVADAAHLHLWTTNAFLFDARQVLEAWGFEYKSCFIWVKPQMGMGNYWRVSHEFCLLGVRGSLPFAEHDEMSWKEWRRGKHSAKPERFYDIVERVSPGPFLELFARRQRPGWVCWGNEIDRDLFYKEAV